MSSSSGVPACLQRRLGAPQAAAEEAESRRKVQHNQHRSEPSCCLKRQVSDVSMGGEGAKEETLELMDRHGTSRGGYR